MKIKLLVQAMIIGVLLFAVQCYSEVNITSASLKYLNGNFIDKKTYKVGLERANSNFTLLPLSLNILQNFPSDTTLTTILVQKDQDGSHRIERTFVTHICNPKDKLRKYLPPFLKELTASGKCVQKGHYSFNDSGQFEFYKLLSPEEIKNHYFDAHNTIRTPEAKIISIDIASKSV